MHPKHNTASLSFPFVFFFFQTAMEESGDIVSFCGFAKMKKVVGDNGLKNVVWNHCVRTANT